MAAPVSRQGFPSIREARELLMARAKEIVDLYLTNAKEAHEQGRYDIAQSSLEFLIRHMPRDGGQAIIESDAGKPKEVEARPTGPTIQIGFALGNVPQAKELPAATVEVIDVKPDE